MARDGTANDPPAHDLGAAGRDPSAHHRPDGVGSAVDEREQELGWIERIVSGDLGAFAPLYERHGQRIFAICVRYLGHGPDAEEQAQEILIRIIEKIDRFKGESAFSTWAYRLAVNHLLNFINRRRDLQPSLDQAPEPSAAPPHTALRIALERAIAELPDDQRAVVILHDREGFKHREIAEILGIEPGTSRSHLSRARKLLREMLSDIRPQSSDSSTTTSHARGGG